MNKITDETKSILFDAAEKMLRFSYAPYSNFCVGAALLSADGKIFTGCNVENAAYGPSNCAERTAVFKAISEGVKDFVALAIVGGKNGVIEDFCSPCGVCRQVLAEFCSKDFLILLKDKKNQVKEFTLEQLLPESFSL